MGMRKPALSPLPGESILASIKPHILAFYDLYLVWVWVLILSAVFLIYGADIVAITGNPLSYALGYVGFSQQTIDGGFLAAIPYVSDGMSAVNEAVNPVKTFTQEYASVGLWILSLLVSALIISVFRIDFKWTATLTGIGLFSAAVTWYFELGPDATYYIASVICIMGAASVEIYRRSHTFYITNKRIITEVRFVGHKMNELSYDKINNVVLDQGLIGSIFNFGTLIPMTASGLGMGTDFSAVSVGAARGGASGMLGAQVTGGRSVSTPRTRSMYCLFGVSDPGKIHDLISRNLHDFVEAPYLRRVNEQLDEINKKLGRGGAP